MPLAAPVTTPTVISRSPVGSAPKCGSAEGVADRDALRSLDEVRVRPRGDARELDVVESAEELAEDGAGLQSGEVRAQTEVPPEAEGHVSRCVLGEGVEGVGVRERLLVTVRRRVR